MNEKEQYTLEVLYAAHKVLKEFQNGDDLDVAMCELSHAVDNYKTEVIQHGRQKTKRN